MLFEIRLLLKPGSPYSFGGTPKARQPLMLLCLLSPVPCPSLSHVHTSVTKPAICLMWFLKYLNGQPAKNIIPLIRQKTVLKKTRKREWRARDVTNRGGSGGASPPASRVPLAPPKARAKPFSLRCYGLTAQIANFSYKMIICIAVTNTSK